MRLLFLLTQDLESPSGLGRYWPLARQMARLGYTVEMAALHPAWRSLPQRDFVRDGVRVTYAAQMHILREGNRRRYFSPLRLLLVTTLATAALMRIAATRPVDAIHIAKAQPMNGLAGWLGARLRRKQLYLDCDDYEAASNNFSSPWQKAVVAWWEDRLPLAARSVTVNTTFLRDRCIRLGVPPDRVQVIPNGFDPDRFDAASDGEREAVRQRWGLQGRQVVLYLGSLSLSNHPILLLLDAFAQVVRRLPAAALWLVGGGEDYDRLALAIRERGLEQAVILAGHIHPAHVASIYVASDVLVDPVEEDDIARARSPLKIVEGLACGLPVVTGDVGDRAMMVAGGEAGMLVRPGDAGSLAEGVLSILADPIRRARLVARGRSVSEQFRWDRLVQEFTKIYENQPSERA